MSKIQTNPTPDSFWPPTDNPELDYAHRIIRDTNYSVFLTGKAGTGKSTFIREFCKNTTKKMVLLAPTGIAAINVRGATIHSFFQFPFGPILPGDSRLDDIRYRKDKRELIKKLELLIIDEVSMVRADLMDAMDHSLKRVRSSTLPFGGVQLLLVGDLFQLEPVVQSKEWIPLEQHYKSPFYFSSIVINQVELVNIELEKVYRQSDAEFVALLNRIRSGYPQTDDLVRLNRRPTHPPYSDKRPCVHLTGKRSMADGTNKMKLEELNGEKRVFQGLINGKFPVRALPAEEKLELKLGAQVMFVRNEGPPFKRWVNGSIGTVELFDDAGVQIKLDNGRVVPVSPVSWDNISYRFDSKTGRIEEEIQGSFTQLPIRLAWAITIHKSQGLTFERLILDLGHGAFAAGQLYVALSRATTYEGIFLRGKLRMRDVIVRDQVLEYYKKTNDLEQIHRILQMDADNSI